MIKRLIFAALTLPLLCLLIFGHFPIPLLIAFAFASTATAIEIINFSKVKVYKYNYFLLVLSSLISYLILYFSIFNPGQLPTWLNPLYSIIIFLFLFIFVNVSIFAFKKDFSDFFQNATYPILAFLYGVVLFGSTYALRYINFYSESAHPSTGVISIGWIFAISWMYDAGGYFIGTAFGKVKLSLASSPNKSWAGLWGGILFAVIAHFVVLFVSYRVFKEEVFQFIPFQNIPLGIVLSIIGAILAQLGDLAASVMKRACGVKDSGTIMGGHGGMLDTIDSLILYGFIFFVFSIFNYKLI